ncbi:hypothetical protein Tco_1088397, partial [Tanacetum coccineum]
TVEEEIALCKGWVRISEDIVAGNSRKEDGFYLEIIQHMQTNYHITNCQTYDMINGKWKTVRTKVAQFCEAGGDEEEDVQDVQRPMGRDKAKKKTSTSMTMRTRWLG